MKDDLSIFDDFSIFNEADREEISRVATSIAMALAIDQRDVIRLISKSISVAPLNNFANLTKSLSMECKGETPVRKGDYIWMGGERKLWRKLSKSERKRAEKEMEENSKNHGIYGNVRATNRNS